MSGLDVNRGNGQVLRNLNSGAQPFNRGSVQQVPSSLILDGRKYIELSDSRSYNRSSPVSSQAVLSQQDMNRVPVSLSSGLRGYNPGPQPGIFGLVQTLPRSQSQEYPNQTMPARYTQTMQHNTNRSQVVQQQADQQLSSNHNQQSSKQKLLNQQNSQQLYQQQQQQLMFQRQQAVQQQQQHDAQQQQHQQQVFHQQQQQQQALHQQQQQVLHQQQQQVLHQQKQQAVHNLQQHNIHQQQEQQRQHAIHQLNQQQQQQKALEQQQAVQHLLERQRAHEEEHRKRQSREIQENLAALRINSQDTQADTDRTYMNVQPIAVVGRGGRILRPGEVKESFQQDACGKRVPVVPKSQEVKHKKEPLYSTPLQFPPPDSKMASGASMFDDCIYANYAPASLYSNYSNYSELEVLRSTDSQGSNEDEPTEGLPNLGDSPVSSSYSELRQANIVGVPPGGLVAHPGDGSIYEPVLPPKGVPGPNSIHFKSLSSGSTDSDYFGCCVQCGAKIVGEGSGCSAMGRLFHIKCFTCTQCGRQLQGLPFYAVEGSPLCEADYTNTLEKCCKCFKPILERILRATGKPYHPSCFTCVACNKSLDGIPFTVDATNQIHCIEDFHRRFAPRCSVCKEPIMPTPGQEETVRVVALDRSFHLQCYRCVDCNLLLSSEEEGRGCYPLDNTVLCRQCNTRRIQALTSKISSQ